MKRQQLNDEQKEQLSIMPILSDDLKQSYLRKELFYKVIESKSKAEAKVAYKKEQAAMESELEEYSKEIETVGK